MLLLFVNTHTHTHGHGFILTIGRILNNKETYIEHQRERVQHTNDRTSVFNIKFDKSIFLHYLFDSARAVPNNFSKFSPSQNHADSPLLSTTERIFPLITPTR